MRSASRAAFAVLTLVTALATPALAAEPALRIRGDLPLSGTLTLAEIRAMPSDTVGWNYYGERHVVRGVPLDQVLRRFGYDRGPMSREQAPVDKRPGYKKVVLASAPDGFLAVLSCAEISAEMGATRVLVVWEMDGKPLAPEQGPLRLAVLTDLEPSRSIYQLTDLEVVDLRRQAPRR